MSNRCEKLRKYELNDEQKKIFEDEGYELLEIYYDESKSRPERRMKYIHKRCGEMHDVRVDHFFHDGERCVCLRKLNSAEIKSTQDYQNKIDSVFGPGEYTVTGSYIGRKKPITVRHKCGHEYSIKRAEYLFYNKGNGGKCPICTPGSINTKEILESKFKLHGLDLTLLEPFKSGKVNYYVRNNKCGHEYYIRTYDILKDIPCQCPLCTGAQSSSQEKELQKFISEYLPDSRKKKFTITGHISFELDSYSAENKIGFEMDGLYWHSEKVVGKSYHLDKLNYFYNQGIRVINIFEDEWNYKKDIIKDKLKSIMGVQKERIYARRCTVKEIDASIRNNFLEENHIQGSDKANISLGLYNGDTLVAVMSFCKLRKALGQSKSKAGHYELSRFAGLLGYTIVGGFSKLLKYAIRNYDISDIITYADLRFTDERSNVYLKNGFTLDHKSKPSYYYMKNFKKRENRYTYRKSELKKLFPDIYSKDKSEFEIMDEAGYNRIWDCGNLVYKMEIRK